jgi:lysine 2,3-aminomutase
MEWKFTGASYIGDPRMMRSAFERKPEPGKHLSPDPTPAGEQVSSGEIFRMSALRQKEWQRLANLPEETIQLIVQRLPVRIPRHLMRIPEPDRSAVLRQFLPHRNELDSDGLEDPLQEEKHRPAPLVIHRYRNRVLFLRTNLCAGYCRYCTRARIVGKPPHPTRRDVEESLAYIAAHPEINEVILSGGDPLVLSDQQLHSLLQQLRNIPHIRILRVATRIFLFLPHRVTNRLAELLAEYQPLYVVTQFNHPAEFLPDVDRAIACLVNRGIPILNQSVLLRGVNDDPQTMLNLVQKLIERRIRPYYLHQLDPVQGSLHFRVPVSRGKEIINHLRANIGGYAVPTYVFDDPNEPAKKLLYP